MNINLCTRYQNSNGNVYRYRHVVWQHCSLASDATPVSINSCSTTKIERETEREKAKAKRKSAKTISWRSEHWRRICCAYLRLRSQRVRFIRIVCARAATKEIK